MTKWKELGDLKKAKIVYSAELLVFAIVFLILGILKIANLYNLSKSASWYIYFFVILTMAGGTWFIVDLIWTLVSKKRRKKHSLIDKIIVIPSSLGTYIFDIRALIVGIETIREPLPFSQNTLLNYYTGTLFIYLALVYIFQAIYHYKYPVPLLLAELEENKKEEIKEEEKEDNKSETKEDNKEAN